MLLYLTTIVNPQTQNLSYTFQYLVHINMHACSHNIHYDKWQTISIHATIITNIMFILTIYFFQCYIILSLHTYIIWRFGAYQRIYLVISLAFSKTTLWCHHIIVQKTVEKEGKHCISIIRKDITIVYFQWPDAEGTSLIWFKRS